MSAQIIPAAPSFQPIGFWMEDDEEDPKRERDSRTFVSLEEIETWIGEHIKPGRQA
jgi:hypothetical protein